MKKKEGKTRKLFNLSFGVEQKQAYDVTTARVDQQSKTKTRNSSDESGPRKKVFRGGEKRKISFDFRCEKSKMKTRSEENSRKISRHGRAT